MAEKTTNTAPAKDPWLTWSGVKKEAQRVRWPQWKTDGNKDGIGKTTGEVLTFTAFFALYFVLCDFLVTYLLKVIGIGA